MTPLDVALTAARQDAQKQSAFYGAFLKAQLFIPTLDPSAPDPAPRRSQEGETFTPYIVEQNGKMYLPVFDLFERLSSWIPREATYIYMPAHALVRCIQGDIHLALNIGTPFWKELVPDEIRWLREAVERAQPHATTVPAGTRIIVGTPAQIPDGLQTALRDCLRRNNEIRKAYLGRVHLVAPGEQPHLVVALEPDQPVQAVLDSIRLDVGIVVKPFIQRDTYIGIAFVGFDRIASDIKQATNPFYSRQEN